MHILTSYVLYNKDLGFAGYSSFKDPYSTLSQLKADFQLAKNYGAVELDLQNGQISYKDSEKIVHFDIIVYMMISKSELLSNSFIDVMNLNPELDVVIVQQDIYQKVSYKFFRDIIDKMTTLL